MHHSLSGWLLNQQKNKILASLVRFNVSFRFFFHLFNQKYVLKN